MRIWAVLLVLIMVLPAAMSQVSGPVREVAFHQFQDIRFVQEEFLQQCDTGGAVVSEAGLAFTFDEEMQDDGTAAPLAPVGGGYTTSGCGTMRKPLQVPPTTDHVIVRFMADRTREDFVVITANAPLVQDLVVRDAAMREVQSRAVFEPGAGTQPMEAFEFAFVGNLGGNIFLDWVFSDAGLTQQNPGASPASGQDFGASVREASLEAIAPAPVDQVRSTSQDIRDGTRLTTEHRVAVEIPSFDNRPSAVRVRVAPGLDLSHVIAPDGLRLADPATFEEGVVGLDHDEVVVELRAAYTQAVVPQDLVAQHGPGVYTFVFQQSSGLEVSPALLPFSIILLITPLPFAALAWLESRAFRREAFGGYARSARNLQYGVVLVFLYYVAVVASAAVGGRLDLMAVTPVPLEGILLYVQLALGVVAFTALWLVARELYLLVKPRPDNGLNDTL